MELNPKQLLVRWIPFLLFPLASCFLLANPPSIAAQVVRSNPPANNVVENVRGGFALATLARSEQWQDRLEISPSQAAQLEQARHRLGYVGVRTQLTGTLTERTTKVEPELRKILSKEQITAFSHLYLRDAFRWDRRELFTDKEVVEYIGLDEQQQKRIAEAVRELLDEPFEHNYFKEHVAKLVQQLNAKQQRLAQHLLSKRLVPDDILRAQEGTDVVDPPYVSSKHLTMSKILALQFQRGHPALPSLNQDQTARIKGLFKEYLAPRQNPGETKELRTYDAKAEKLLRDVFRPNELLIFLQDDSELALQESMASFVCTEEFAQYLEITPAQRSALVQWCKPIDEDILKFHRDCERRGMQTLVDMLPAPAREKFIDLVGDWSDK